MSSIKDFLLTEKRGEFLVCDPAVFAVGAGYCVIFLTDCPGIGWAEVDGREYGETVGGLRRSDLVVHRVFVPMEELDAAGGYSVNFAPVRERAPYWPKSGEVATARYAFRGIKDKKSLNVYHLCDTHSHLSGPVAAAGFFPDGADLIILNGDIPDHSGSAEMIRKVHLLCAQVAHGSIPIVFSRGNHDTRGECAVDFVFQTPNVNGDFFFTTRLGGVWTLVLDCGEDKPDSSEEYGGMVAFDAYRRRQTEFLKRINENARNEYLAPGVTSRIAVCHIYPALNDNLFSKEIFSEWMEQLNAMGLDLMLCGHNHNTLFFGKEAAPGFAQRNFPMAIGGKMEGSGYVGTALKISPEKIDLAFTDSEKKVRESFVIAK
ncbi:MAG: metallophosphoesterase [Clostridia bacterium]|nr:metallophosphoesterase [Clostridia bacterium]